MSDIDSDNDSKYGEDSETSDFEVEKPKIANNVNKLVNKFNIDNMNDVDNSSDEDSDNDNENDNDAKIMNENDNDDDNDINIDDYDDDDEEKDDDIMDNSDNEHSVNEKIQYGGNGAKGKGGYESEDEDEDDEDSDNYLQKFNQEINRNYVNEVHPECISHNYNEIEHLTKIIRNSQNIIVDPLHKTLPFLTKYERARIIGQRAKQIEAGAKPFVNVPENVIEGHIIAELELKEKKIPFIIRRPLPSGGCEYWKLKDLEML